MQPPLHRRVFQSRSRFIILLTLFLCSAGFVAISSLPLSLYPSVESPTIRAEFIFEGSAKTFYEQWGKDIENSLRSIHGVQYVEANYSQTKVIYYNYFRWGIGSDIAKKEVKMVTSFFRARMPDYLPDVFIYYYDPGTENYLAIKHKSLQGHELSQYIKANLLPQIESIPGVGRAWVSEPGSDYVHVKLNPYKLIKLGITVDEIVDVLQSNQFDFSLGRYKSANGSEFNVQLTSSNTTLEALRSLQLTNRYQQPILLADVAEIRIDYESYDRQFSYEGKEVVAVAMWPEPDANLFETSAVFLKSVESSFGDEAEVIVLNHPNDFIVESITYLFYSIITGMLAAALMILLFYRKFHTMLLITMTMPISLGISFIVMKVSGIGINLISLSALSITIGIVVDSAIIVIDHIIQGDKNNNTWRDWVCESTEQVAPSIIASMATSIVVFVPMIFTEPMTASILSELVYSAVIILCVSLFICLLLIPSLVIFFGEDRFANKIHEKPDKSSNFFFQWFVMFAQKTSLIIILIVSSFAGASYLIFELKDKVPEEVIAEPKAEIIDVNLIFKAEGLSPQAKQQIIEPFESQIRQGLDKHIRSIYIDFRRNNTYVSIHLESYRTVDHDVKLLRELLKETEEIAVEIEPWVTSSLKVATRPDMVVMLNHHDEDFNRNLTESALAFLNQQKNVLRSKMTPKNQRTNIIDIQLRENVLNSATNTELQYYKAKLFNFVKYLIAPQDLYSIQLQQEGELPLKLSIDNAKESSFLNVPVEISEQLIFVDQLVENKSVPVWRDFFSRNGRITNKIEIWLDDSARLSRSQSLLFENLKRTLGEKFNLKLVPISIDDVGNETVKNIRSLQLALTLAIILTFLVIFFHYQKIVLSFIVLSVVWFGIAGSLLFLYLLNSTLSLNSMLGILIMTGLVVNNSILITDFFLKNMAMGCSVVDAIWGSLSQRMRALMVTNMTTVMGMLPLAIGMGAGQDITKPLGISVAGGLIVATCMTILILPSLLIFYGQHIQIAPNQQVRQKQDLT